MKRAYQVIERSDSKGLADFLAQEASGLLPIVELIQRTEMAVDELIDAAGRSAIEAVLTLSAQQIAGPKHPGKFIPPAPPGADQAAEAAESGSQSTVRSPGDVIGWHGRQHGVVRLAERKIRITKPRLRRKGKGGGEAEIPAYTAMQNNPSVGDRLLGILMRGVSTRNYKEVLPEMAQTVGVSKSSISREFQEASEEALKQLGERRFEEKDIVVIWIDGLIVGGHHVLVALGADVQGAKHVLGLAAGASENAVVVKGLLEDLVRRGVRPGRRRLFVIDGSKALRCAIDAVYGADNPVQRCRNHKVRNVLGYLPETLCDQVGAAMKAAYRLDAQAGMSQLEKQAQWLEKEYPDAAASLREGLAEMFTVNRLGLPASLRRCLCTTNVIESPNGTVRQKIGRVRHWRDGNMVLRWAASAFLASEKSFRRVMGCHQLWMLEAWLNESKDEENLNQHQKVG